MKVLITGATGLIGSRLAKACLEKGYDVNYLTTSKEKVESEKEVTQLFQFYLFITCTRYMYRVQYQVPGN